MTDIKQIRGEIVSKVLDLEHVADECEAFESELNTSNKKYFHVVAKLEPDDDINVAFSVPIENQSIFITASDGNAALVRRVLSNLDEIESESGPLSVSDVVAFDDPELIKCRIAGVVLLPLSVSGVLCDLDEKIYINGKEYNFRLVTFLSQKEYKLWKTHGSDALMSYFDENDKDLLTFYQAEETEH